MSGSERITVEQEAIQMYDYSAKRRLAFVESPCLRVAISKCLEECGEGEAISKTDSSWD